LAGYIVVGLGTLVVLVRVCRLFGGSGLVGFGPGDDELARGDRCLFCCMLSFLMSARVLSRVC